MKSLPEKSLSVSMIFKASLILALFMGWVFPSAFAGDVDWLNEVTNAPANPPMETTGKVVPLLLDNAGEPIRDLTKWELRRRAIREAWLTFLGPMPDPRPQVKLEIIQEEELPEVVRSLVRYEGEPGIFVLLFIRK